MEGWTKPAGCLALADEEEVVERLVAVIRDLRPATVVTFDPGGIYGHPDHVTISARATEAFRRAAAEPGGPTTLYHQALSRSDLARWDEMEAQWAALRGEESAAPKEPTADDLLQQRRFERARPARRGLHHPRRRPARARPEAGGVRLPRQPDPGRLVDRAARDARRLAGARDVHPRGAAAAARGAGDGPPRRGITPAMSRSARTDEVDEALLAQRRDGPRGGRRRAGRAGRDRAARPRRRRAALPAPRRRGRPPGSKNKPKPAAAAAATAAAAAAARRRRSRPARGAPGPPPRPPAGPRPPAPRDAAGRRAASGLTIEQIVAVESPREPRLSPDGRRVAYTAEAAGARQVFVLDLRSGQVRQVTASEHAVSDPRWSPDGSRLAYVREKAIWIVGIDGTRPTIVADHPAGQHSPRWAPDGRRIAFVSRRRGWSQAWVVAAPLPRRGPRPAREARPEPRALTPVGMDVEDLQWSPDGSRIAVLAQRDPDLTTMQVTVVDAAGGEERVVAGAGAWETSPRWLPDGSGLLVASDRDGWFQVVRVPLDGGDRPALTSGPVDHGDYNGGFGMAPLPSPDGSRFVHPVLRDGLVDLVVAPLAAAAPARRGPGRPPKRRPAGGRPRARGPDQPGRRRLARRGLAARRERDPRDRRVRARLRRTSGSSRSPPRTALARDRGA